MHYELNVARKSQDDGVGDFYYYDHFFATAERSLATKDELIEAAAIFFRAFPPPEFQVSACRYDDPVETDMTMGDGTRTELDITQLSHGQIVEVHGTKQADE